MSTWFSSARLCGLVLLAACFNFALQGQQLQMVSVPNPASGPADSGSGDSMTPVISRDGRYVLFASTANNLMVLGTTNPIPAVSPAPLNVFLRDRTNGTTTLVSVNALGTGGGDDNSWPVALSTNGQYVLFESNAGNLVPGDTNNATDVFVRDLASGITMLFSAGTNGSAANGYSRGSAMTPDGRYVAFLSGASNLVPGDTNGMVDVFVRDLQSGLTTLVSVGARASGPAAPIPTGSAPEMTSDGRYVVFSSPGTNLVAGVTTTSEVYVRDMVAGTTLWASSGAKAAVQAVFRAATATSFNYAVSADGQFVAYEACPASGSAGLILRYNVLSSSTDLVHTNAEVAPLGDNRSLDMTPDGRFIAFVANTNGATCILVWDAQSGVATLASGDLSNQVPANSVCAWPTLDASGRFVAFLSSGSNLVANSLAGDSHLYLRDTLAGTTALVNADTNGVGTILTTTPMPSLSADGRYVAFECPDRSLVARGGNHNLDVFVRDVTAGVTELVSARASALPSTAPDGPSMLFASPVSADGRYIAFVSDADNLAANDTNSREDVFVRDLLLGTNVLVSVSTNNAAPGDMPSSEPALSSDGRYVAFSSSADNLVAGDTNKVRDVFVRDLQAGTTALMSLNSSGTGPGNGDSSSPMMSADGRYVVFRSKATNLAGGSFTGENLFLRDLLAGTTRALTTTGASPPVSMTPDGRHVVFQGVPASGFYIWDTQAAARIYTSTTSGVSAVALGPDGRRVLYATSSGLYVVDFVANTNGQITAGRLALRPGLRFSADGRFLVYAACPSAGGTSQAYLFDFQTGTSLLISRSYNSTGAANGNSDSPDISADGRLVAYRSDATDIAPGAANGSPGIFVYDQQAGMTTLLSASRFGNQSADNRCRQPIFSGNGQTLVFESWASDLVGQTFSANGNIFAYNLYSSSPIVLFQAALVPDARGPWLTWPALPGKTYRVQFKNSLGDPEWQELNGAVTVVGGTGYLRDLTPAPAQRFYRIAAF